MAAAERPGDPGRRRASSRTLLHQGLAGAVLGFPLSIWLTGLLVHYATGGNDDDAKYQVVMWSVVPMWVLIVSLVFLARSRLSCWAWLIGANFVAAALVQAVR